MSEYIVDVTASSDEVLRETTRNLTEIVRCRDCVYNAKDTDGICYRFGHEHFNQPDGFCAWAKKKKEGCNHD